MFCDMGGRIRVKGNREAMQAGRLRQWISWPPEEGAAGVNHSLTIGPGDGTLRMRFTRLPAPSDTRHFLKLPLRVKDLLPDRPPVRPSLQERHGNGAEALFYRPCGVLTLERTGENLPKSSSNLLEKISFRSAWKFFLAQQNDRLILRIEIHCALQQCCHSASLINLTVTCPGGL